MPFDLKGLSLYQTLLNDRCVSFHIKRPKETYAATPRHVIARRESSGLLHLIPGVVPRKDQLLLEELKRIQNWKRVKKHSFELAKKLYSLLWRFNGDPEVIMPHMDRPTALDAKSARRVNSALRSHRASLEGSLRAGTVFRIPDAEVTFGNPGRAAKVYARSVLIFEVVQNQVIIIPFTTRIDRMDPSMDILFDGSGRGEALLRSDRPVVEDYPYPFITTKTALILRASQPMTRRGFLAGALTHVGNVRLELLHFIKDRMKNSHAKP